MPGVWVTPLEAVLARIRRACARAGRDPEGVRLVAVTKGQSEERVARDLLASGHRLLGESRVQEWRAKAEALADYGAEWHLIGNLQTNKVKYCQGFTLIHSLNSQRLADALERFGHKHGHRFRVLLEVDVAGEEAKQGVSLPDAPALADYVRGLRRVELCGLMTIAPYSDDPENSRKIFRKLRELRDRLALRELSMGMTGDFEVAVEEGATYLRVGSALFPEAPKDDEAGNGVEESHET